MRHEYSHEVRKQSHVVGWSLSNTLATDSCIDALKAGLLIAKPEIINSDQGCQFTSGEWGDYLNDEKIKISMTGKGRCLDNIYIERLWRSFKQEELYLNEYASAKELRKAIKAYIEFYNHKRWHQSLDYKTPAEVFFATAGKEEAGGRSRHWGHLTFDKKNNFRIIKDLSTKECLK